MGPSFRRRGAALLGIAFAAAGIQARAQLQPKAAPLDRVVVTAARFPQPFSDLVADVSVITADDIARAGADSVAELLSRVAGVEIATNGGPGSTTAVFLRGANSGHTLVLIDGLRVGSSTSGTTALEAVSLSDVDHIEILRGPASSLYGADAIGGVIQIFTRRAEGAFSANASAGYGTYATAVVTAGASGTARPLRYALRRVRAFSRACVTGTEVRAGTTRIARAVLAAIVVAYACESPTAPVAAVDSAGTRIELAAPAKRIVSLAPHATELLFAAGAGERVVGVLSPADAPAEAKDVQRVGDARAIDLERILALKPDLAVAWPYIASGEIDRLRNLGIPIFVSDPRTPEAIPDELERLGALAGTLDSASAAAAALRARLSALERRERGAASVAVFYEIWPKPLYTIGGRHLISTALALCGGRNIFARIETPAPAVGVEDVLEARPEAIVAGTDDAVRPAWLDGWQRWRALPAVEHGNLFVVDANLLHRAGPRFIEGAEQLCGALDRARANLHR